MAKNYAIPIYVVSPVWCDITYTYTVVSTDGGNAVSFNDDQTVREFTFDYTSDLALVGTAYFVDYLITVKG